MKYSSARLGSHNHTSGLLRRRVAITGSAAGAVLLAVALGLQQSPAFAATPVGLGTATSYSVLAGTTVTNTGLTTLQGDLGVSPGSAITGFPPGVSTGAVHAADAVALQAQSDVITAYNNAAGQPLNTSVSGDLVGLTLTEGVYNSTSSLALSGRLTLDGQGNPNSVFVFQAASTLITASASSIVLINGARACNVFWQVGSSATLGTASHFKGTILALTSITVQTGTTVEGRALARNGQVSLDTNVFTSASCTSTPSTSPPATATPTPTPTTTQTATATATATATETSTGTTTGTTPATTTQSTSPTPTATTTRQANETETTPSVSAVPLADTGGEGRNKGTNVDTGAGRPGEGPAALGAIVAGLAVTVAIVFAAGALASRRRSSRE